MHIDRTTFYHFLFPVLKMGMQFEQKQDMPPLYLDGSTQDMFPII